MKTKYNPHFFIRLIVGTLIIINALYRAFNIELYVNFVLESFSKFTIPSDVLVLSATFIPFVEFFIGALILLKVGVRSSLAGAFIISTLMTALILIGDLGALQLVYHVIIMTGLLYLFDYYRTMVLKENFKFKKLI